MDFAIQKGRQIIMPAGHPHAVRAEERFKMANKFGASGFIVKTDDLNKQIKSINSVLDMANRYHGKKG